MPARPSSHHPSSHHPSSHHGSTRPASARTRQLADRIRIIVAEMLERRIKDPRLGFVTITEARITGDLHDATVFYTVLGSLEEQEASAAALQSATGVLRAEVGRQTGLRFTPTLTFIADAMPDNARHIEDLLLAAQAEDARVHQVASTAEYAGDADPYRHDDELVELDDLDTDDAADLVADPAEPELPRR